MNGRRNKKIKNQIITRQIQKIDELKKKILELEAGNKEKEEIISSIEGIRTDLINTVDSLKDKRKEYDELILELMKMKRAINQSVFKGRWNLIRFLIK